MNTADAPPNTNSLDPLAHAACAQSNGAAPPIARTHVRAVVEAPQARRLVRRCRHHVLAVGSYAHREHETAVPHERAHLRAFEKGVTCARPLVSRAERSTARCQAHARSRSCSAEGDDNVEWSDAKEVLQGAEEKRNHYKWRASEKTKLEG
eukprot:6186896-Pleurochrysis_carterae.AAC.3